MPGVGLEVLLAQRPVDQRLEAGDVARRADREHAEHPVDVEPLREGGRMGVVDVVAELGQQPTRALGRVPALTVHRHRGRRLRQHADAQPPRIVRSGVRRGGALEGVEIARLRAGEEVKDRGGVAHATRHHQLARHALRRHGRPRRPRDAAARRLEAHEPGPCGRDPDRAADVVGVGRGHQSRRDGRGGTAAEPPGERSGAQGFAHGP